MIGDFMEKEILKKIANTIRQLSIEAIERAKSGHPGLPLGCAEIGAYLYGVALNHYPKNPTFPNRDIFILSAGHGSMLLYSSLFLAGFDFTLEDIKNFRQIDSKTPGHPEYDIKRGVEATTGPLGHGIGNAVGLAISYKILAEKFNTEDILLFDNKIFCLVGDGCLMEGVSSEASSLAGHLKLNNLIVIYDSNNICLDGPTSETFSEDVKKRYLSYDWEVYKIDGYDLDRLDEIISDIKKKQEKPVFIIAHTIIGKGSPKEGSNKAHGAPLGEKELKETKKNLNLPEEEFFVSEEVKRFFKKRLIEQKKMERSWYEKFKRWEERYPTLFEEYLKMEDKIISFDLEEKLKDLNIKPNLSGREASSEVINFLANFLPFLYSGSADLSSSDKTFLNNYSIIKSSDFKGRNIKYGVREFAMGTISNGIFLSNMIVPICGTFLVFSDYMKNAIRLASMMRLKIIYQFTHDSIFLGEDGPTHQPVEQLASLRAIPNLNVIRPACSYEVKMAWIAALQYEGPTAIVLSRQNLVDIDSTNIPFEKGVKKGAYIVKKEKNKAAFTFFASGSELKLALKVSERLEERNIDTRVISFPSFELFERQSKKYKEEILRNCGKKISIEAGVSLGWAKYVGEDGISISVDRFGLSAKSVDLEKRFNFTVEDILKRIF
ncbi:MAG: transketolase [Chlamydiae bacterium SM23_39]|nr:MAG: transketolase [Chlamydiae bacterium SM23_39]